MVMGNNYSLPITNYSLLITKYSLTMIDIIHQAPELVMSRNPILYKFLAKASDGQAFGSRGVRGTIVCLEGFSTGDTLTVTFTEPQNPPVSLVFQFNATLSSDVQILPSFSGTITSETLLTYFQGIATRLSAHPRLAPFFSFSAVQTGSSVTVQAVAKSTVLGWAVSFSSSSDLAIYATYPAIGDPRPIFHKIVYQLFFENDYASGNFEALPLLESPTDAQGYLSLDIADILDTHFTNHLSAQPIPSFSSNALEKSDNLRRYYVRIAENYGSPRVQTAWQYLAVTYVRFGGIAQNLWQDAPVWLTSSALKDSILSWYPLCKIVDIEQPEWLPYKASSEGETPSIRVTITNQEGQTSEILAYETSDLVLKKHETVLLPVGVKQLNLPNVDTILRYQVQVKNRNIIGSSSKSETYTYYIDTQYHESKRYIVYLNGFGVPQTLRCTGVFSPLLNVTRTESKRPLAPMSDVAKAGDVALRTMSDYALTYRSGYLRNDEIHALQELLTAEYVFEVCEAGFIPLRLTDKQFRLPETGQFTSVVEFSAVPRLDYRNYSNGHKFTLTTPSLSDDFDENNRLALAIKWR
jgi:hypothetical protein